MKLKEKQFGFTYVVIILGVVLIGAIGFLAWRMLNGTAPPTENTKHVVSDPNAGYVVIKEWGVRLKPIQSLSNIVYTAGELPGTDGVAVFSTEALAFYGEACGAAQAGASPLGRLLRVKGDQDITPSMNVAFTVQIGSYDYLYSTPQAICSEDKAAIALQTDQLKLFKNSITSLEAVP